ncbi:pyoverdine biosynthesis transaminase PtaA [Pseudomonas sp. LRF_L74]|uniref:pyoverdine biosynthesis transaminase PtaA n=1 Tax=Pseudomonas sp. LRF_L74 TaxID=3369422 RepID=UPI003F618E77
MTSLNRRSFVSLAAVASAIPLLASSTLSQAHSYVEPGYDDIIRLNYNESPFGPCKDAREAMKEAVDLSGRYRYGEQVRFIKLFAKLHGVPSDYVNVFCGSREPLQHALSAFTASRGLVLASPTYDAPVNAARAKGITVHEVPLTVDHAHDLPAMLAADRNAGLLYICNPNNPTGTLTPRQAIEQALEEKAKDTIVVIDEAYIHFSEERSCVDLAAKRNDVIVLHTFSKIYGMAGARLGVAIGHPDLLDRLQLFGGRNFIPLAASLGGQASLEDKQVIADRQRINNAIRNDSIAWFAKQGFTSTQSHSNCFMVNLRKPAAPVIEALEKHKILVGRTWQEWPNWVRVSVGTREEMATLHKAFEQVIKTA